MSTKTLVWIGMIVGSTIGGLIPSIWDAGMFSFSSVLLSSGGAIVGIYAGWKLGTDFF